MGDYTEAERAALVEQAGRQVMAIRCPRHQATMQPTHSIAAREVKDRLLYREFEGLPRGPEWMVRYVDLKCPTCGRTALMVEVAEA